MLRLTLQALHRARLSCRVPEPVADLDTPDDAFALRADPRCPPSIRAALHPDPLAA